MAKNCCGSIKLYRKKKAIQEFCLARDVYLPTKDSVQGIKVADKILIAMHYSRWKKLGEYQWYSYYGITKLLDALIDDRLDEYAKEQQLSNRTEKSAPVKPITANKIKEIETNKILKYIFEE